MRARIREFTAARDFLDKLPVPWICTPGNHDIPSLNLFRRSVRPYSRYRKYISKDLAPTYEADNYVAIGLNTARRAHLKTLDWSRGRVSKAHLSELEDKLSAIDPLKRRIIFAHHPFTLPPGAEHRGIVTRFSKALRSFERASVDLVLAGHLHLPNIEPLKPSKSLLSEDTSKRKPIISVQASTTTSVRLKGQPNSLNAIYLKPEEIEIQRHEWDGSGFSPNHSQIFYQ